MAGEIAWVRRMSAPGNIGGRRYRQDACLDQLARNERADRRIAEPHRQIEPIRDEIADMVAHDQLDPDVGISIEEGGDLAHEHDAREEGIDVHAQPATDDGSGPGRFQRGLLDAVEMRADPLIEAAPLIGERHGSCRAIEHADPDAGFQPRDGPTDAGGRQVQRLGRAHHRARLDHGHQHGHAGKKAAIIGHGLFPIWSLDCFDITALQSTVVSRHIRP